jgi:DNA-binding HxlR family transcriptional regulator
MTEQPSDDKKLKPRDGLLEKAFGEASENFGRELAPVGSTAGKVAARAAHQLLRTASGAIWGYEKIQDWIEDKVASKIEGVPEDELTEPGLRIAGPAIEAMRFAGDAEEIKELFAQVIASDMQKALKSQVHPSFVEIIKQIDGPDTRVLRAFVNIPSHIRVYLKAFIVEGRPHAHREMFSAYTFQVPEMSSGQIARSLNSLERLGLIVTKENSYPANDVMEALCKLITDSEPFANPKKALEARNARATEGKDGIYLTPLGKAFIRVCFPPKPKKTVDTPQPK